MSVRGCRLAGRVFFLSAAIAAALPGQLALAQTCIDISSCNPASLNGILFVDGVKNKSLAAAVNACPQTCWIIDSFPEKFTTNPFDSIGAKSVKLTLGRGTWITTTPIIIPTKSQLEGSGRGDPGFSGTVIQADASFPPNTAMVEMGNTGTSMGVRVENLTIDCNNVPGCIGLQNIRAQEQSGARHVLIENITGVGLDIQGTAAQNSGPYEDMEFAGGSDFSVTTASLCARIINVPAFRGLHGATCNFNNYYVHPAIGIQMDSPGTLNDIHIEGTQTGIGVGINFPGTGAILQNVFGGGPNMSALVHVYSGREILLTGLVRSTTPTLLIRNDHSVHDASLAFYVVHDGGKHPPGAGVFAGAPAYPANANSGAQSRFESESAVESLDLLDRMSVYNGTVVLDANGEAEVRLSAAIESRGAQFHYQLTPMGGAAALYVARELQGSSFRIAGGKPGLKVSWQITVIRANSDSTDTERSAATQAGSN